MKYRTQFKLAFAAFLVSLFWHQLEAQDKAAPPTGELINLDPTSHDHLVGSRPGRKGGFRLEAVEFEDRTIVHNYGHGGYGVTLSPGTAMESVRLAQNQLNKSLTVKIIGAGVIGLTTAYVLALEGYSVDVIAKDFYPNLVSAVAAAMWNPYPIAADDETRSQMLWRVQNESLLWYKDLLERPAWGIREVTMYVPTNSPGAEVPYYQPFDQTTVKWYSRIPIEGFKVGGYAVSTYFIDTSLYLPELMEKLGDLGVKFKPRELTSLNDFAKENPKGTVIFNASGLGARWLVPDENMYPIRGDLCIFESNNISSENGNDYLLSWSERGDYMFTRVSLPNRTGQYIFGGVYEENDDSIQPVDKFCNRTLGSYLEFLRISTGQTK